MLVFKLFKKRLEDLSLINQKEVLKQIFNLEVVYLYSCEIEDGMIEIRIYDGSYYRFRFIFDGEVDEVFFDVRLSKMYKYIDFNVNKFRKYLDIFDEKNKFFYLMRLFALNDERYLDDIFKG